MAFGRWRGVEETSVADFAITLLLQLISLNYQYRAFSKAPHKSNLVYSNSDLQLRSVQVEGTGTHTLYTSSSVV
jgi:hypothetical protein